MSLAQVLLMVVYYAMLLVVATVMFYRALLVVRYYRRAGDDAPPAALFATEPVVTIQLPIFNERYVVERLLDSVAAIDWPRDRLEIQVLDDSTDETRHVAAAKVAALRARGIDAVHLHRTDRTGYKAGALAAATPIARGDFLAVFDADFVPEPDFLRRTMDHFTDASVGFVQTRWSYLNREYGVLTQGMGMLLDGHFVLEQTTRSRAGYIFNFNGTGGVWRRRAIDQAGGWHDDTICEDTDLSYRAHLAGYRGLFLRDVPCPSELPVQVSALKSQQHRWAKGLTECFLKLMPLLWRSRLPFKKKLDASFHLGANMAFPASLFMTVVALPVMLLRMQGLGATGLATAIDSFVFGLVVVTQLLFYAVATREIHANWWSRLRFLPFFPLIGVGLAVNNARGVFEALFGYRTEFVRTPKFGVLGRDTPEAMNRARALVSLRELIQPLLEVGFACYYVRMSFIQLRHGLVGSAMITLVLSLGLFTMGGATFRTILARRFPSVPRRRRTPARR
ncbi:MAG TPA: glycosyltransferase, partial [Planctomycetota bacterium]|nr:glycosyltransferase [Planctomycetota bacterium]